MSNVIQFPAKAIAPPPPASTVLSVEDELAAELLKLAAELLKLAELNHQTHRMLKDILKRTKHK